MEILNNRYRVIKELPSNINNVRNCIVRDLLETSPIDIELKVIKSSFMNKDFIDFLKYKFKLLNNLNNTFHERPYEFVRLFSINDTKLIEDSYIYTSEYIENKIPILDFLKTALPEDILKIIVYLCQALNYISNYGIGYKYVDLNNIFVIKQDKNFHLKIKDIITTKLEDSEHVVRVEDSNFENFNYQPNTLKNIFLSILDGRSFINIPDNYLYDIKNKYQNMDLNEEHRKIINCIFHISEKAINKTNNKKNYPFYEIILDINEYLHLNFSLTFQMLLDKNYTYTNTALKIVGRQTEKEEIISCFNDLNSGKDINNIFFVVGSEKSGKTNFLSEISFLFSLEKCDVYNIPGLENFSEEKFILHIVKALFSRASLNVNKKIEREIQNSIENLIYRKKNYSPSELNILKYKILNRISNLITKKVFSDTIIFIVDDIHIATDFILDIFLTLTTENLSSKKIMFIFSYDEEFIKKNYYAEKFLKIITDQNKTKKLRLQNLSEKETSNLIKTILQVNSVPEILTKKIYSYTSGSPTFIIEVLKELIYKEDVKKDYITGLCKLSNKIFDPMLPIEISLSTEAIVKNKIKKLNPNEITVLSALSIFYNDFYLQDLYEIIDLDKELIDLAITSFFKLGFIKEISSSIFKYAVSNEILQKIFRLEFAHIDKKNLHLKMVKKIEDTDEIFIYEMLWHASKAGMNEIAIEYSIIHEPKLKEIYSPKNYILIFQKIFSLIPINDINKKLYVLLLIINTHISLDDNDECLNRIIEAEDLLKNNSFDKSLAVKLFTVKAEVEIVMGYQVIDIQHTLVKANDYLPYIKDKYLKLKLSCVNVKFLEYQNKYDESIKAAKELIKICGKSKKNLDIKLTAMLELAKNLYNLELYDEAKKIYIEILKNTLKINDPRIENSALNNLAVIYSNIDHNFKDAITCYNRIIEKCNLITCIHPLIQTLAMLNAASINILLGNHLEAYNICETAIKKIKQNLLYSHLFSGYVIMYDIVIALGRYEEAMMYKDKINKMLNNKKTIKKDIYLFSFYNSEALLYGIMGNYKQEIKILNKLINSNYKIYNIYKLFIAFRIEICKLCMYDEKTSKALLKAYNAMTSHKDYSVFYHLFIYDILILIRKMVIIRKDLKFNIILQNILKNDISNFSYIIKAHFYFFRSYLNNTAALELLLKINHLVENNEYAELKIDTDIRLGMLYLEKKKINTAIIYFIEAQKIINSILKTIPPKIQLKFFNAKNYSLPFIIVYDYINKKLKQSYYDINLKINTRQLNMFLSGKIIDSLENNDLFIKEIVDQNLSLTKFKNMKIEDIVNNFSDDFFKNIQILTEFISLNLLASSYNLLLVNDENAIEPMFKFNKNKIIEDIAKYLEAFDFPEELPSTINIELPYILIPITDSKEANRIIAYLVFISDNKITNFGKFGKVFCLNIKNIFKPLIESYKAQQDASIDKLTSAFTRKYTELLFDDILSYAKNYKKTLSVLMYDLDHFKRINDEFGHQAGDIVLRQTANTVLNMLSSDCILGRYGGEEFVVLMPDTQIEEAKIFAEKIRKQIEYLKFDNQNIKITVSIGLSSFPQSGFNKQELLTKADQALYKAKNSGRNRCYIWKNNFDTSFKTADRLTGIFSGDVLKDTKTITTFIETISLIRNSVVKHERLQICLEKIITAVDADNGIFIKIKDNNISKKIIYRNKNKYLGFNINSDLIKKTIAGRIGIYKIDWDNPTRKHDIIGGLNWDSVLINPIINKEKIMAIIYLVADIKKKEFDAGDLNLVNFLSNCIAPFF